LTEWLHDLCGCGAVRPVDGQVAKGLAWYIACRLVEAKTPRDMYSMASTSIEDLQQIFVDTTGGSCGLELPVQEMLACISRREVLLARFHQRWSMPLAGDVRDEVEALMSFVETRLESMGSQPVRRQLYSQAPSSCPSPRTSPPRSSDSE
jgi:hypothetical protein